MADSADYVFKPHERPTLPGSPANPDHPSRRRIGYFAIGCLIGVTGGLGNALVDALVLLDDDAPLLQRHGLWRGTMHLVDDARWHAVFSEVREHATEIHAGGSCANAVSTVSLLGG